MEGAAYFVHGGASAEHGNGGRDRLSPTTQSVYYLHSTALYWYGRYGNQTEQILIPRCTSIIFKGKDLIEEEVASLVFLAPLFSALGSLRLFSTTVLGKEGTMDAMSDGATRVVLEPFLSINQNLIR